MNKLKNTTDSLEGLTRVKPQASNKEGLLSHKISQVFERSLPSYENPQEVEHYWSQMNRDSGITSKTRDQRKIFSITSFVIQKARILDIPAQKVRDVYFRRYRDPAAYITALRNYIPELEADLALLSSSEQIDSRFRVRIA